MATPGGPTTQSLATQRGAVDTAVPFVLGRVDRDGRTYLMVRYPDGQIDYVDASVAPNAEVGDPFIPDTMPSEDLISDLVPRTSVRPSLRPSFGGDGGSGPAGLEGVSDRELLARLLVAEAGSEGRLGKLAVGSVIGNRVKDGRYGEGLRGVMLKDAAFSPLNYYTGAAGGQQGVDVLSDRYAPSAEDYEIADAVISGKYVDPTGGATHFVNPDISQPSWMKPSFRAIGSHRFGRADDDKPLADVDQDKLTAFLSSGGRGTSGSSVEAPDLFDDARPATAIKIKAPSEKGGGGLLGLFRNILGGGAKDPTIGELVDLGVDTGLAKAAVEAKAKKGGGGIFDLEGFEDIMAAIPQGPKTPSRLPTTIMRGRSGSGTSALRRLGVASLV